MGTRDIYIAFFIMLLFIIVTEHLFHDWSSGPNAWWLFKSIFIFGVNYERRFETD
jgi:hypothetical protein